MKRKEYTARCKKVLGRETKNPKGRRQPMSVNLTTLAAKFTTVAASGLSPVLLMVMGYISNILLMLHQQGTQNSTVVRIIRILSFSVREFEKELRDAVEKSPTPYDDKLIDELFEVIDEVLDSNELV